jgi:hypothetical protein
LAARIADGTEIYRGWPEIPQPLAPPAEHRYFRIVELPLMTSLKTSLYCSLRKDGITWAELSRRLKWNWESVDRLFRLDHASRLNQLGAAFRAPGRSGEAIGRSGDVRIKGHA